MSGDRRLQWQEAKGGLMAAVTAATQVEKLGQRAEVWGKLIKQLPKWRPGARNPQAPQLLEDVQTAMLDDLDAMPDGQWVQDTIQATAPHADVAGRQRLLRRALANTGFEAPGAKAVLRAGPGEGLERLLEAMPPEFKASVLSTDDALDAALAIEDDAARAEALRVLIWKEEDPARLEEVAARFRGGNPFEAARIFIQVGARLDKLGRDGDPMLKEAEALVANLPEKGQKKLGRKLQEARERMGGKAPAKAEPKVREAPRPTGDATHMLALVNTYEGGLKPPHLRAAARAAPLCHAFGLRLGLVDFPMDDLETFVAAVESETGIGEGGRYLAGLLHAGRLHTEPVGMLVATTPKPNRPWAPDGAPVCMLMGVGPKGLPQRWLDAAAGHYEITGSGVSLETATAMGILADRLARL